MLFPAIQSDSHFYLQVSTQHKLYVEQSGNMTGIPVVFLHGGPGASSEPVHRRFFDPEKYRIILFDQRGCGKSQPHANLQQNTTRYLIEDMEKIRIELGIDRWVLFGGSWGSTLALAYAQAHPDRVLGLVLRGIFLCRQQDIDWFYQAGASRLFPEAWQGFQLPIPENERKDMIAAYHRRLTSDNELERMAAAKAWSIWEGSTATLRPSSSVLDYFSDPHTALSIARIECHYFLNKGFLQENQLLDNMHKIKHIPGYIVQGRYDAICPIDQAFALNKRWPKSQLKIIPDAGHSASEEGIAQALILSTNAMAEIIS
jgi:proline iminopeptidase